LDNWDKNKLRTVFSDGFERQDVYRIFITYPIIIKRTNGEYIVLLGTSISALEFFSHYGNIENINSQFLVAYNKNATLVSVGASIDLIGENFFGSIAQKYINYDDVLNNSTRRLLTGNSNYAVYGYGTAERLTTGYPFMLITSLNIFLS
jgi:hypothetical protein